MLLQEQGRMSEVPCTGGPVHAWWYEIVLVIGGGRRLTVEGMATSRVPLMTMVVEAQRFDLKTL